MNAGGPLEEGGVTSIVDDAASSSQTVSILLDESGSDADRVARLLPLVYDQLRAVAERALATERPNHTLQATALVHEAYPVGLE